MPTTCTRRAGVHRYAGWIEFLSCSTPLLCPRGNRGRSLQQTRTLSASRCRFSTSTQGIWRVLPGALPANGPHVRPGSNAHHNGRPRQRSRTRLWLTQRGPIPRSAGGRLTCSRSPGLVTVPVLSPMTNWAVATDQSGRRQYRSAVPSLAGSLARRTIDGHRNEAQSALVGKERMACISPRRCKSFRFVIGCRGNQRKAVSGFGRVDSVWDRDLHHEPWSYGESPHSPGVREGAGEDSGEATRQGLAEGVVLFRAHSAMHTREPYWGVAALLRSTVLWTSCAKGPVRLLSGTIAMGLGFLPTPKIEKAA